MKKPLYLSRNVLNGKEIVDWAKSVGFSKSLTADKLHVTISYSKKPVDFRRVNRENTKITINGGKRKLEQFDGGATVLRFESDMLQKRWNQMEELGASWDYDGYKPHVTISFEADDIDVSKIKAYRGPIKLGPEIVQELNTNWKDTIEEE